MKKKVRIPKGLVFVIIILLNVVLFIYSMGCLKKNDETPQKLEITKKTADEKYQNLVNVCDSMNRNFALDSLRVVKYKTFVVEDSVVRYVIDFEDGGKCCAVTPLRNNPQENILEGDKVIHIRKYVPNFNYETEVGDISVFEYVAYMDSITGQWYWL